MKTMAKRTLQATMKVLMTGTVALGTTLTTEKAIDLGRDATTMIIDKVRPVEVKSFRKITVGNETITGRANCKKFLKERAEKAEKFDKVYTMTKHAVACATGAAVTIASNDLINEASGWQVRGDLQDEVGSLDTPI